MIAALLLATQATAPGAAIDIATLPTLRFVGSAPQQDPKTALFVRDEVAAGRCAAAARTPEGYALKVDMAVLASPDGQARQVIPVAIGCPTVEQYAAGLLSAMARRNVDVSDASGRGWYRTTLVFTWTG